MDKVKKGRRPYSISVGQRPMKSDHVHPCKAESLETVLFFGFRPCWVGCQQCGYIVKKCSFLF